MTLQAATGHTPQRLPWRDPRPCSLLRTTSWPRCCLRTRAQNNAGVSQNSSKRASLDASSLCHDKGSVTRRSKSPQSRGEKAGRFPTLWTGRGVLTRNAPVHRSAACLATATLRSSSSRIAGSFSLCTAICGVYNEQRARSEKPRHSQRPNKRKRKPQCIPDDNPPPHTAPCCSIL